MPGLRRNGVEPPLPKLTWCAQWHCTYWYADIASSVALNFLHIFAVHLWGWAVTGMAAFFINLGLEESDDQFHAPTALPPSYIYWHAALHMQLRRSNDHHPYCQKQPHFAFLSNAASKTLLEPNWYRITAFRQTARVSRNYTYCVQQIVLHARKHGNILEGCVIFLKCWLLGKATFHWTQRWVLFCPRTAYQMTIIRNR